MFAFACVFLRSALSDRQCHTNAFKRFRKDRPYIHSLCNTSDLLARETDPTQSLHIKQTKAAANVLQWFTSFLPTIKIGFGA